MKCGRQITVKRLIFVGTEGMLFIYNKHVWWQVVMSNGIVSITLTLPGGSVTNVTYKGSDNLLLIQDKETDRG